MRWVRLIVVLLAVPASAAVYENAIVVDDEDDLFTLQQRGDISDDVLETLLELIREGVDLNSASRDQLYDLPGLTYQDVDAILLYRQQKGAIADPVELVGAEAISAEQLLQIAPFIRLEPPKPKLPVGGKFRLTSRYTAEDNLAPPALLTADLKFPFRLSAGAMVISTRRSVVPPIYDVPTDTLVTPGFLYLPHLPRFYAQWKSGDFKVVAGTYTLGFSERLVLDTTRRVTPHGIYLSNDFRRPNELASACRYSSLGQTLNSVLDECTNADGKSRYITPDYDWREVFRGVAASAENIHLGGEHRLAAYGFLSYQSRSLYQYELFDRRVCEDPRDDKDDNCKAPPVYLTEAELTGSTKLKFTTLTNLFDELTAGGHVDYSPSPRFRFGLTGYGAAPFFNSAGPMKLDFQEWSRYPNGGPFGALGLDARAVFGDVSLALEAARSFDGAVGNLGGGWAVEQRTTYSTRRQELEVSLRFYDDHFTNPYARPISAPDEVDGQRARNELGLRARWFFKPNADWRLKARLDFWMLPFTVATQGPAGMASLYGLVRGEFTGWSFLEPILWVDVRNKNLANNERGRCSAGTVLFVEGDPSPCNGDFYRVAARVEVRPFRDRRWLEAAVQGWFTWQDDVAKVFRDEQRFREDVQVFFEAKSRPLDWLSLRLRSRYLFQDISNNEYLEQSLWSFLEAAVIPVPGTRLSARYDLYVWLDERASTLNKAPSPEHRFMLDLRTGF